MRVAEVKGRQLSRGAAIEAFESVPHLQLNGDLHSSGVVRVNRLTKKSNPMMPV